MTKEEIAAGLRTAIEHGYSLENAAESFVNAGYNPNDVKDAKEIVSMGASSIVRPDKPMQIEDTSALKQTSIPMPSKVSQSESFSAAPNQKAQTQTKSGASKWMILGISILLVLIGIILFFMIFGESILSMFMK
ncbi:MAG: hypothetical protein WCK90_04690 [archaeon]